MHGGRWGTGYGYTCCAYGFLILALYFYGIARTLRGPSRLRWYAAIRAFSYMVSFAFTGLPLAVFTMTAHCKFAHREIADLCFCLNGAANAITYTFWVTQPRKKVQTTADIESSMLRHFFDLSEFDAADSDVFLARRAAEIAVAEAKALRTCSSDFKAEGSADP